MVCRRNYQVELKRIGIELLSMLMKAKWIRLHIHLFYAYKKPLSRKSPQQQPNSQEGEVPAFDPNILCRIVRARS